MRGITAHHRPRIAALASILGLTACGKAAVVLDPPAGSPGSATPVAIAAAQAGAVPVALPISRITVLRQRPDGEAGQRPASYRVTVVPTAGAVRFQAAAYQDFTSRNVLAIRTVENTQVPVSVGNTFTDETATRIGQIGSVIAAVVRTGVVGPLTFGPNAQTRQGRCVGSDLPDFFIDLAGSGQLSGTDRPVPDSAGCFSWSLSVVPGSASPSGSITRAEFQALLGSAQGRTARFWPVPTCLTVKLTVTATGVAAPVIASTMTVADPDRVHLYPLPEAGTLAMHPVCGADLTDKPVDRWGAVFAALSAIDTQAQAIAKAAE